MGNGASVVVDVLNSRLMPPLVAEALVIVGLVGPDTDARISAIESQPLPLFPIVYVASHSVVGRPIWPPQ